MDRARPAARGRSRAGRRASSQLRERNAAAGFDTSTAKAMIDGVPHGETAALLEPYCSHAEDGFSGELHFDEATISALRLPTGRRRIRAAPAHHGRPRHPRRPRRHRGRPAPSTASGPAPPHRASLDGAARGCPPLRPARHHREHPGPVGRARPLPGVDDRGGADAAPATRSATMADGGAELAMGSDWPVSPADPWLAIHVAVNRWAPALPRTFPPRRPASSRRRSTRSTSPSPSRRRWAPIRAARRAGAGTLRTTPRRRARRPRRGDGRSVRPAPVADRGRPIAGDRRSRRRRPRDVRRDRMPPHPVAPLCRSRPPVDSISAPSPTDRAPRLDA